MARRGQPQGTGAGDDQHRDPPGQRIAHRMPQHQPDHRGDQRQRDHRGHKNAGDPVGHLGNGRFRRRRFADHLDDLGQSGVLPHPGSPAGEGTGLVQCGGGDAVPGGLVHRDALAGEGGFIDRAGPLHHHAVHRNGLAGPDQEQISLDHLVDGDGDLLALPQQGGRLGGQLHEALQGIGGPPLGAGLQQLAHGDEGEDHGRRLKVEIHAVGHDRRAIASRLGGGHGKQRIGAVTKGRRRAQGHQGIHVRGPVPEALEAADKKLLVDHHDRRRQQQLGQPLGHMVSLVEGRQRPAPHHVPHGKVHQHRQKQQGPEQALFQRQGLMVGQQILARVCRRRRPLFRRAIAAGLNGLDDLLGGGAPLHAHGVGQQTDRAGGHPGHLGDSFLDAGAAGGAAHSCHAELFHRITPFLGRDRWGSLHQFL